MAITFVGGTTQDSGGALSLTLPIDGAAQADDFLIAFVKQSENTARRTWDNDGGGGNGWTRLAYNRTTGGRDQETAIYYKIHSGTENNPTFTWNTSGTNEPMSGSLLVYRGVDTAEPIADFGYASAQNDANPRNPPVEVSESPATILTFHAATHDDISSPAAPTGYTMRTQVWAGASNDHRNHFTADLIGLVLICSTGQASSCGAIPAWLLRASGSRPLRARVFLKYGMTLRGLREKPKQSYHGLIRRSQ